MSGGRGAGRGSWLVVAAGALLTLAGCGDGGTSSGSRAAGGGADAASGGIGGGAGPGGAPGSDAPPAAGGAPGSGSAAGPDGAVGASRDGSAGVAPVAADGAASADAGSGSGIEADAGAPAGARDASPARPPATDGAGGACHDLPPVAATVTPTASEGAPPPDLRPTGGAIRDGTYALTSVEIFNVKQPARYRLFRFGALLRVSGSGTRTDLSFRSSVPSVGQEAEERTAAQIVVAGTTLTTRRLCPEPDERGMSGYTAEGDTIRLFHDDLGEAAVSTYTRR